MTTLAERFWPKVIRAGEDECWVWTASCTTYGYGQIQVRTPKGWRPVQASRVAFMLTHGPIPDGAHVLHGCDNPPCCNPAHLRLGTAADNMRDKVERGRARGSTPKLTESDVADIRRRSGTESQRSLAGSFNVDQSTISLIVNGKRRRGVV